MSNAKQLLGILGEQTAKSSLELEGYRVLTCNWRCRLGEIDIIAAQDDRLVFIEVRSRKGRNFGTAEESVDLRKQQKIRLAAQYYMQQHKLDQTLIRFDVIALLFDYNNQLISYKHVEAAF